ncbi:tripartite tricarboxylate transporter permease [Halanaerobium salsuginis]|jgi:putative tricarboxylic transport membrane protein|uniref:Putative tricarboxylic transport membrane protein n=1 Tax=Halanaerobium salsuginis TaxID=29563 RepID=A0A1I4IHP7_9FIRM|nr:tripartite tricarboxylate transporter permease [Halanaerobium salsuginis]SFL53860.1 putative tricarboxylic transport membrane protein [Halanaerobium salsuginis]
MLLGGIIAVLDFHTILLMFLGVIIGIIFGSIPGMTATMAVVLFIPVTFSMDPISGMAVMISLYVGGISGGLIPAVLLNMPGTPSSIASTFDGYPLTQKGKAGKALGTAVVVSFLGGVISFLILIFASPLLAKVALKFGPFEYFSLIFFALTMIATVTRGSFLMGIISGLIGMSITLIGMAPVDGVDRFTFGFIQLKQGFELLPVLIGLFAVSEIFKEAESGVKKEIYDVKTVKGFGLSFKELKEQIFNVVRSGVIGTMIGILPGIGGSTASILSYGQAKKSSKYPEKFGTGIIDGLVASEAGNNGLTGGALVPLLALGIPGDSTTAVLLGALMIQGVQPGPLLFKTNPKLIYGIFGALLIANFIMLLVEFYGIRIFINILKIPKEILLPIVFVTCSLGAFALNNNIFSVYVVIAFGIIGYLLSKVGIQLAPLIIGFILGPMAESNLRRALMSSSGDLTPLFTSPISLLFLIATLISVISVIFRQYRLYRNTNFN